MVLVTIKFYTHVVCMGMGVTQIQLRVYSGHGHRCRYKNMALTDVDYICTYTCTLGYTYICMYTNTLM